MSAPLQGKDNCLYARREKLIDLVPVDIPINLAIATAWRIASCPSNAIPVYNCTSGATNPIQWGQVESLGMAAMRRYPMERVLWYPGGSFKQSKFVNKICQVRTTSHIVLIIVTSSSQLSHKALWPKIEVTVAKN